MRLLVLPLILFGCGGGARALAPDERSPVCQALLASVHHDFRCTEAELDLAARRLLADSPVSRFTATVTLRPDGRLSRFEGLKVLTDDPLAEVPECAVQTIRAFTAPESDHARVLPVVLRYDASTPKGAAVGPDGECVLTLNP